jgi:type I restriction enzyme S subunit
MSIKSKANGQALPPGWLYLELGEFGDLYCGQSPSVAQVNSNNRGVPYVTGPEQWNGHALHIDKWTEHPKRCVPAGCIFITVKGAGVGKLFPGVECAIGRDIYAFHPHSELDHRYVFHALKYSIDQIIARAQGDIPGLSKAHILDHKIGLPGIQEQGRIVTKIEGLLSEVDKAVEYLTTAKKQLKAYRQAILRDAFEGKMTSEWRTLNQKKVGSTEDTLSSIQEQRSNFHRAHKQPRQSNKERRDSQSSDGRFDIFTPPIEVAPPEDVAELPTIPPSWVYIRLGSLLHRIEAGKSFKCDERQPQKHEVGVAKVSAVSWGEYDETESKTCRDPSRVNPALFIKDGDFILSRANTIELVGACVIARNVTQNVMLSDKTLRLKFAVNREEYVLQYLRSRSGRSEIMKRSTGNQESMRNIGQDRISSIVVPICSEEEASVILGRLNKAFERIAVLESEIEQTLRQADILRLSILKRAFSGHLTFQDSSDEPAAKMVERVNLVRNKVKKNNKTKSKEAA